MREAIRAQTWGRRLKGLPPDLNLAEIDGIVIHYTGNPRVDARGLAVPAYIRGIQEYHLNHKTAGWVAIAYNYLIDQEGRLWEGRGLDFRNGANNPTNRTNVSICLLNGVQDNEPTLEQIETVQAFHRELQQRIGKPIGITGHRDHSATACPGDRIQRHIANRTFHANTAPAATRPPAAGETLVKPPSCTVYQARVWAEQNNAHRRFDDIITATVQVADAQRAANAGRAIDPAVALAQAAKETGWGHFRGVLGPERHNPAGIKIADGGGNFDPDAHESWTTWDEGARAHLNHLAAYTGLTPVGTPHGRYHTVRRTEWAGTIETAEQLGARWAPSGTYGEDVARMTRDLQQTPNRVTQPEPAEQPPAPATAQAPQPAKKLYTVMPGDSWWRIAQIQLNNGTRWQEIADLNDRVTLHPGMIIKLP